MHSVPPTRRRPLERQWCHPLSDNRAVCTPSAHPIIGATQRLDPGIRCHPPNRSAEPRNGCHPPDQGREKNDANGATHFLAIGAAHPMRNRNVQWVQPSRRPPLERFAEWVLPNVFRTRRIRWGRRFDGVRSFVLAGGSIHKHHRKPGWATVRKSPRGSAQLTSEYPEFLTV